MHHEKLPPGFARALREKARAHKKLINRRNVSLPGNGIFDRYRYPVLTAEHVPLSWRYDLDPATNPYCMERLMVDAAFNAGAIFLKGKYHLAARVEGADRKSFFGIAESESPVDGFRFRENPVVVRPFGEPDTNVYDIRLTAHQDGWIYGVFCTERPAPGGGAVARCGIIRSRDMKDWERLPDLKTPSPQQRNAVLHPELVQGRYAFYTRPQEDFMGTRGGGGIGFGTVDSIENAEVREETIIDPSQVFHTIKDMKNGQGPAPIKTRAGWLHIAHAVRGTAAGSRYVLYAFLTDLDEPWKVLSRPGGHLMAPQGEERVGDVSNVLFCNAAVSNEKGEIYIYYASSDTRMHVAATTHERMINYVRNTPEDGLRTGVSVEQRLGLLASNRRFLKGNAQARKIVS